MTIQNRINKQYRILVTGDLICFVLALFLTVTIREGTLPDAKEFDLYALPFSIIFFIWILVYYIAGMYDFHSLVFKEKMIRLLVISQLINSGFVILLLYFVPKFTIAPKTVLLIDLIITICLLYLWRTSYLNYVSATNKERVLIVGKSIIAEELRTLVSRASQLGLVLADELPVDMVIIDLTNNNEKAEVTNLYSLIWKGVRFLDMHKFYEDLYGRVPLELLSERWVLEHISLYPKPIYTILKRAMDIIIATPLFVLSLLSWPFIYVANMFDEGRGLFSFQIRVGQMDKPIRIMKLRTMTNGNDGGLWVDLNKNRTTKVGLFLRRLRVDEFPQLWNVIKGDVSLIGPRPEFPEPVREYESTLPFYKVRHLIKPGLSGWAQVNQIENPHHGVDVNLTARKLSYDLFYVKNRSILLDFKITLRTIKTLVSRVGV
ncbi:MAG TPA: sugar transferase [Candidatus Paceibacterota bacterium]